MHFNLPWKKNTKEIAPKNTPRHWDGFLDKYTNKAEIIKTESFQKLYASPEDRKGFIDEAPGLIREFVKDIDFNIRTLVSYLDKEIKHDKNSGLEKELCGRLMRALNDLVRVTSEDTQALATNIEDHMFPYMRGVEEMGSLYKRIDGNRELLTDPKILPEMMSPLKDSLHDQAVRKLNTLIIANSGLLSNSLKEALSAESSLDDSSTEETEGDDSISDDEIEKLDKALGNYKSSCFALMALLIEVNGHVVSLVEEGTTKAKSIFELVVGDIELPDDFRKILNL